VQTQTGSSQYVKQTASDELTIPLVNWLSAVCLQPSIFNSMKLLQC
jgi:hypothetical protein